MAVRPPVVDLSMTPSTAASARSGTSGILWERAARAGFAVSGAVHLMLGYLILRLSLEGGDKETDSNAALSSLRDAPLGVAFLWLAVVAWVALGAWRLVDAVWHGASAKDRAADTGRAVIYGALAVSAATIASGTEASSSDAQAQGFAASLMSAPAGRLLVGALGLAVIGAGAYLLHKGVTRAFEKDLNRAPRAVTNAGVVGHSAKGVALGVVGMLFTYAAFTADADKAEGLDGAIDNLLGAPAGPVVVAAVGIGFAAYGVYAFARAKYARM